MICRGSQSWSETKIPNVLYANAALSTRAEMPPVGKVAVAQKAEDFGVLKRKPQAQNGVT